MPVVPRVTAPLGRRAISATWSPASVNANQEWEVLSVTSVSMDIGIMDLTGAKVRHD